MQKNGYLRYDLPEKIAEHFLNFFITGINAPLFSLTGIS
jgi:hypothetical protein